MLLLFKYPLQFSCIFFMPDATFIEVTILLGPQVTGPSGQMTWIRGGPKSLDANNILEAIDNRFDIYHYVQFCLFKSMLESLNGIFIFGQLL